MSRRSKKKKAKNTIKNNRTFIIKFVIGMALMEVYYFALYFTMGSQMNTFEVITREMNITGYMEPFYWFSLNSQRELLNDKTRPVIK